MAIDSREKRASAASLPFLPLYPLADSSVTADDRMQTTSVYSLPKWASGSDNETPSGWTDVANAYDDDFTTAASEDAREAQIPLVITWSPLRTEKWRFLGVQKNIVDDESDPDIIVELFYDGAWHEQWGTGKDATPKDEWLEYPIQDIELVNAARITSDNVDHYLHVYEFQLLDLDNLYVPSSRPLVGGSLATISLIKGGLVR